MEIMQRYVDIKSCVYDVHTHEAATSYTMLLIGTINYATHCALRGAHDKAFEILRAAEETAENVKEKDLRNFLKCMISNNMANFYYKRKKYNATARYARDALQNWRKLCAVEGTTYHMLKYTTANCLAGRYSDASETMSNVIMLFEEADTLKGKGLQPPFQISYKLPYTFNANDLDIGLECVIRHNQAVIQCALRKYSSALTICDECMDMARDLFDVNHSWMKQILRTHDFATRQSQGSNFNDFKIKPDEYHHKEIQSKNSKIRKKIEMETQKTRKGRSAPGSASSTRTFTREMPVATNATQRRRNRILAIFPFLQGKIDETQLKVKDDGISPSPDIPTPTSTTSLTRQSSVKTILSEARERPFEKSPPKKRSNVVRQLPPVSLKDRREEKLEIAQKSGQTTARSATTPPSHRSLADEYSNDSQVDDNKTADQPPEGQSDISLPIWAVLRLQRFSRIVRAKRKVGAKKQAKTEQMEHFLAAEKDELASKLEELLGFVNDPVVVTGNAQALDYEYNAE